MPIEPVTGKDILEEVYDPERPPIPDNILPTVDPGEDDNPDREPTLEEKFSNMPVGTMVDQEIAQMVTDRRMASEIHRQSKKLIWDKCWEHMKQVYDNTGKEAWQSTIFQPDTTKVVEIIVANLHGAILGPEVPIEWQCKVKEHEQHIKDINDIMKNDFEKCKFKSHFTDFLRGLCIAGTSVGKVGYVKSEDIVIVKERQRASLIERTIASALGRDIQPKPDKYTPTRMLTKDYANIDYRDIYNIYPEPFTTDISKDHWLIERSRITNKELIEGANDPDEFLRLRNVTQDLLNRSGSHDVEEDPETQQRRWTLQQQSTNMIYFDPDSPHDLLEYWGPVPLWMIQPEARNDEATKYDMVNGWIWVVDGKWVVRSVLNPYRDGEPPYFKGTYIRIPNDWWGIGPAELMLSLQISKNEMVNTKTDNVNLMLNKVLAILKDKVPNGLWDRLESAPGQVWPFEGIDDIRKVMMPVEFPNLVRDIYAGIDIVDSAIQEVTGAVKSTIGTGGSASETGGGTFRGQLLNRQTASERFMLYARTLESSCLGDAYKKMYQRVYQYKTFEAIEQIIGQERMKVFDLMTPEHVDQVARLVPLGVMTMESKGVKLAQMADYAKLWVGQPWFKAYDFARQMWIEMGYTDPDTVIFSAEEMQQFNEFRRMIAGQGGGPPSSGPQGGLIGGPGGQSPPPPLPTGSPDLPPVAGVGPGPVGPAQGVKPVLPGGGGV